MKYWDSSALVSLVVEEHGSTDRRTLVEEDPHIVTWWASRVECASALNRLHRDGAVSLPVLRHLLERLEILASSWAEVNPSDELRLRALRLLRVHPLRAADSLQLAAALTLTAPAMSTLAFVSSDIRLSEAAEKEGFAIH